MTCCDKYRLSCKKRFIDIHMRSSPIKWGGPNTGVIFLHGYTVLCNLLKIIMYVCILRVNNICKQYFHFVNEYKLVFCRCAIYRECSY